MKSELELERLIARVRARDARRQGDPRAAVAAILRPGPDILFIKRAEHPGDPWSGHMAFPGGRREASDPTLMDTARRETREEIGLRLDDHGELVAPLDDVPTHKTGLVVRPFVWTVEQVPGLLPNKEVAAIEWVSVASLMSGSHDTTYPVEYKGQAHRFPAFEVESGVVWGLTYRMLHILFDLLRDE